MSDEFLSHSDAAVLNRNLVLRYIKSHKHVSRTDIWNDMRISRASVTQIIRQMQESGLIVEADGAHAEKRTGVKGRHPSKNLCLNENSRSMYIFDWNSRKLCLVNLGGNILESIDLTFPKNCVPEIFAQIVLKGIEKLHKLHAIDEQQFLGLGISMPGLIDSRNQIVLYSVELGWRNVNIKDLFSVHFENVLLERTGNMIALGEFEYGAARDYNHILLVLMENEGIGASMVVRGDCQHGSNYMYGELGHIKLPSDILCSCGQKGCLEAVVRYHLINNGNVMDDKLIEYLSVAISTAVNLCDPGMVLLSGRLIQNFTPQQQQQLINCVRNQMTDGHMRKLDFHICCEEADMGIKGMSAHIFNHHFSI